MRFLPLDVPEGPRELLARAMAEELAAEGICPQLALTTVIRLLEAVQVSLDSGSHLAGVARLRERRLHLGAAMARSVLASSSG